MHQSSASTLHHPNQPSALLWQHAGSLPLRPTNRGYCEKPGNQNRLSANQYHSPASLILVTAQSEIHRSLRSVETGTCWIPLSDETRMGSIRCIRSASQLMTPAECQMRRTTFIQRSPSILLVGRSKPAFLAHASRSSLCHVGQHPAVRRKERCKSVRLSNNTLQPAHTMCPSRSSCCRHRSMTAPG
jgi:hypothetical protein